jgi:hypothetical protein
MSGTRTPPTISPLPVSTRSLPSVASPIPAASREPTSTRSRSFNINPSDRLKVSSSTTALVTLFANRLETRKDPVTAIQDFKSEKIQSKVLDMSMANIAKIDELTRIVGNQNDILKDIIRTVKTNNQ